MDASPVAIRTNGTSGEDTDGSAFNLRPGIQVIDEDQEFKYMNTVPKLLERRTHADLNTARTWPST